MLEVISPEQFYCADCGKGRGKMHDLKTWPCYFDTMISGHKTFEIRLDDRGFTVGDTLHLREWSPETKSYTGRSLFKRVHLLLRGHEGLKSGYVLMGLLPA